MISDGACWMSDFISGYKIDARQRHCFPFCTKVSETFKSKRRLHAVRYGVLRSAKGFRRLWVIRVVNTTGDFSRNVPSFMLCYFSYISQG